MPVLQDQLSSGARRQVILKVTRQEYLIHEESTLSAPVASDLVKRMALTGQGCRQGKVWDLQLRSSQLYSYSKVNCQNELHPRFPRCVFPA